MEATLRAIADAINADAACDRDMIQARVWTRVPGRERIYLAQATGPARKRWNDVGYVDASGGLVGVPPRIAARVEPLLPAPSASVADDTAFHAAVRRGEAALYGSEADLVEAVRRGHVTADEAMNQDF